MENITRSYKYRISNCDVMLVTKDEKFRKIFLDYFERNYGIRNQRKGFAKVYVTKTFQEGLELVKIENDHNILVIDRNTIDGNWAAYYEQAQDHLMQQLLQHESDSKNIELYKRLFVDQTLFVVLEDTTDFSPDKRLPEHAKIWHMNKQSIFDQIDDTVMVYPRQLHMHMRDPITYLPSAQLMERKLKEVRNQPDQTILFIELNNHDYVKDTLSYNDFCEVELFMADIIEQAVDEQISNAWIGGVAGYFIVAMPVGYRRTLCQRIQALFEENISQVNLSRQDVKLKLVFDNQSLLPPDFRITIND